MAARGLAGTVLVHKVLGAMANAPGVSLDELVEMGNSVVSSLAIVGTSLE